jgi:LysR family transcriptional regulator, regulator for bpeEF and oprC
MLPVNEIQIFAAIVRLGSFIAAARALKVPKTTVSRKVEELENRLGVRLLQRTTRKMSLTEAGQAYFEHCERIITEIEEAEAAVGQLAASPRGVLRITAPYTLGAKYLAQFLPEFLRRYPDINVALDLRNERVDLVGQNVDLALRVGALDDSSYSSRALGTLHSVLVTGVRYAKEAGLPETLEDLAQHRVLALSQRDIHGGRAQWSFVDAAPKKRRAGGVRTISLPRMVLQANDPEPLLHAAIGGEGIAYLPELYVSAAMRSGLALHVLPEWRSEDTPLHAVYPSRRGLSPKVRAFIDFLSERISDVPLFQPAAPKATKASSAARTPLQ